MVQLLQRLPVVLRKVHGLRDKVDFLVVHPEEHLDLRVVQDGGAEPFPG